MYLVPPARLSCHFCDPVPDSVDAAEHRMGISASQAAHERGRSQNLPRPIGTLDTIQLVSHLPRELVSKNGLGYFSIIQENVQCVGRISMFQLA